MKKVSTYFFVALLSVVIFLLGFNQNISKQPHSYYQVYLDGELMGVIESKKELENYINSQADIIRQNVKEYKLKLDAIETFNKYQKDVDSNYSNIDKVNYIITNRNNYNLTDMDIDNLNFYKDQKLYSVSDIDINDLLSFHKKHGKIATLTAVHIEPRFGVLDIDRETFDVKSFREKAVADGSRINAGYMVLEPDVFDYIDNDKTRFEKEPLQRLAAEGELCAYKHNGFWQCMDTKREMEMLHGMVEEGKALWMKWQDNI